MLSPEREGRLTASDHAAALGVHPYCSRQELWRRWNGMGTPPDEASLARMQWGKDHEADAIAVVESELGVIVSACLDRQLFVPYEDWSGCTPDGLIEDDTITEVKCPTQIWNEPPLYYFAQVQSQLAITKRQQCVFAAWTPEESAIWRTSRLSNYWSTVEPILKQCWTNLREGLEPKRSAKPKFDWSPTWERIA